MKVSEQVVEKILSGKLRKKYGLDTTAGSLYHIMRLQGASDLEAQYAVYKKRGIVE